MPTSASSLTILVGQLHVLESVLHQLQEQLHNQEYMLKELVTEARILRNKRNAKRIPL